MHVVEPDQYWNWDLINELCAAIHYQMVRLFIISPEVQYHFCVEKTQTFSQNAPKLPIVSKVSTANYCLQWSKVQERQCFFFFFQLSSGLSLSEIRDTQIYTKLYFTMKRVSRLGLWTQCLLYIQVRRSLNLECAEISPFSWVCLYLSAAYWRFSQVE